MKSKLISTFFLLLSSGIAYAIDPSGARVDWDDYDTNTSDDFAATLMILGVIALVIWFLWCYFKSKE